jgi:hypothetical protein
MSAVLVGFMAASLRQAGYRPGSAGRLRSTKRAKRCTCIDATNLYSQEHAEDQYREVRIHGVLRSWL